MLTSRALPSRALLALSALLTLVSFAPRGDAQTAPPATNTATQSVLLSPEDTFLGLNETNYDSETTLATYTWPDHQAANAILMKFDLATLPAGAVVQEATLQLALVESDANVESTYTVTAHKVLGKNPVIAAATGYTIDGAMAWSPSACCSSGVPLAQADLSPAYDQRAIDKVPGYKSWTLTRMVQEWLADPATNRGLVLNADASKLGDRYRFFASMEHPDGALRPVLSIAYSLPSATLVLSPQDTFLNLNTTNYSTDARLGTYTWPDRQVANAILMMFDLSSLPAGAVVHEAMLRLALVESDAALENTYRVTANKVIRKNPAIATATGHTIDGVAGWTPNACCYGGVPLAQADISPAYDVRDVDKVPGFKVWDLTRIVQEWRADPATNFGLLLNSDASTLRDRYRFFASMEHPDPTLRPVLSLAYTVPSGSQVFSPQDTFLNLNATNYSTHPWLGTYTWPQQKPANAILMKFNLSSFPAGAVVTEATLHLALTESDRDAEATYTVTAHKVVGKNPVIAAATGYTADGVNGWTPNACCYNGVPLAQADVSTAYDTRKIDKVPGYKVFTLTRMVREWLADPATNFGLLLNPDTFRRRTRDRSASLRDRWRYFASMEEPDSGIRPYLRIAYTLDTSDTTPPSVALTAPGPGTTVAGTVTMAANATDDVGVAGVQFKLDGASFGAEDTTAPYSVSWNTAGAANGSHTLAAVARDAAGNVTTSAGVTVTVTNDTTPPSASVTAPGGGTTITGTVTVTGSATDNVGVVGVQFKRNGANLGAEDTTAPYSVSWNTTSVANGSHTLTAVARDAAGNVTTSAGVTVTVTNDTTPPSASVTGPAGGTTVTGTVTVTGSASDNVGVVGVQFKRNGANLGAEDTTSPYSVSWNTASVANGSHTLTAVARDAAGNQTTSAGVSVTVSNGTTAGIAALYPGDVGIETHADVVLVERFEEATLAGVFSRWTDILNGAAMLSSTDVPPGSTGSRSLSIPWVGGGVNDGGHLYKQLSPGVDDTLYVRYYIKYPTSGNYDHTGIWMGGNNPSLTWPNPQAGIKPAGNDRFIAAAEQNDEMSRFDHYNYWMNMRQSGDGSYWGNFLLNNPNVQASTGQWTCVEHMVKLNNPVSAFNGEHAIWLNGVKVSHLGQGFPNGSWSGGIFTQSPAGSPFEGLRWRSDANLKLNWLWLQVYAPGDPAGFSSSVKFDHVVAAKSYIGCLASSGSSDTTAPTVAISSPSGGATVSSTVTVSASASDNVGVAGVQFKLDGNNLGAEDTTSPFSISWNSSAAANGSHALTAVARDAAGNQATSAAVSVNVSNGGAGGVFFESNWDTASGTSTAAVTDGGRWPNYWEFNNGTSVQLLSVVTGGVNGHNALRVQQRGSTYAANVQVDNFAAQSRDYYVRYYMKNDDTSGSGDHIVTADTYQYANLTYMRKYGSASNWSFVVSLYGCGYTYPIGHWGPSQVLANGQWYRFEYHVHYTGANRIQVHPRVYDAAGNLILTDADFLQSDYGGASWNGRSDWTLASYYAAGHDFCVDPTYMNDFGLGNNGQQGAADTGRYWYFSGLQIRGDAWPGPLPGAAPAAVQ